jgi:hypothetical protein
VQQPVEQGKRLFYGRCPWLFDRQGGRIDKVKVPHGLGSPAVFDFPSGMVGRQLVQLL